MVATSQAGDPALALRPPAQLGVAKLLQAGMGQQGAEADAGLGEQGALANLSGTEASANLGLQGQEAATNSLLTGAQGKAAGQMGMWNGIGNTLGSALGGLF